MPKTSFLLPGKLYLLLVVYLLLTAGYNIAVPTTNADDADETAHFTYIHWLAVHNRLPVNIEERRAAGIRARDGYPPFYQLLVSRLVVGYDPGSVDFIKRRGDVSVLLPESTDGHWMPYTLAMKPPYHGPFLLWHLGRLFSSLLGVATIILTYFLVLELFPHRRVLAMLAAGVLAFMPRFVFMTASLSDDPLLAVLMAAYLFTMIRVFKTGGAWYHFVLLGLLLGLGLVTKLSVGLVPVVAVGFLVYLARKQQWSRSQLVGRLTIMAVTGLLATGWWAGFVIWHFGDFQTYGLVTGVFNALVPDVASNLTGADLLHMLQGSETDVAKLGQDSFLDWLIYFSQAFWEVRVRFIDDFLVLGRAVWVSWLIFGLVAVGLGFIWRRLTATQRVGLSLLLLHLGALLPLMLVRHLLNGSVLETAQARHLLMPGATAVGVLVAVGWSYWTGPRPRRWLRPLLPGLLIFWSLVQLYAFYYYFPQPMLVAIDNLGRARVPQPAVLVNQTYFDAFDLIGYTVEPDSTALDVTLVWQSHKPAQKDYLVEVELLNSVGKVASRWLGYSAGGGYPTRAWLPGDQVVDKISLPVFDLPPGSYTVQAHLREAFQAPLQRSTGALFSAPVMLAPQRIAPGVKSLQIDTLRGPMQVDYQLWPFNFFYFGYPNYRYRATIPVAWTGGVGLVVQFKLLSPNGEEYASLTPEGNLQNFIVGPSWASGLYRLKAEVVDNGTIIGQAIVPHPIRIQNNNERQFFPPPMMIPVNANFGNRVKVLGYDLPKRRYQPGEILSIPVHWQSLEIVNTWLRVYNRLYDRDQKLWVISDHGTPPLFKGSITWVPGQVVSFPSEMWLDPKIPNGIYTIHYGVYIPLDGDNVEKRVDLPLVVDGETSDIFYIELGPIKLGGPPQQVLAGEIRPQQARQDNLGDVIQLNGYDLAVQPENKVLELAMFWQSLAVTDQDLTIFTHLRNEQGELVVQYDSPPSSIYPTSLWDPAEVIKSKLQLPVPDKLEPGEYQLVIGLYNPATGQRLPANGAPNGEILLHIFSGTELASLAMSKAP